MSDNPWMNQRDVTPYPGMKSYADPLAQAEVDRLRAELLAAQIQHQAYLIEVRRVHRLVEWPSRCTCVYCTDELGGKAK